MMYAVIFFCVFCHNCPSVVNTAPWTVTAGLFHPCSPGKNLGGSFPSPEDVLTQELNGSARAGGNYFDPEAEAQYCCGRK